MTTEELLRIYWPTGDIPEFEHAVVESEDHNQVVCHVGVTIREILIGHRLTKVGGIGYVCTAPGWEHQGLMHATMKKAHAKLMWLRLADGPLDYVLLNSGHEGLYEPLGYRRAPNLTGDWMVGTLGSAPWHDELVIDFQGETW